MAKFWNRLSYECDLWKQGLSYVAGVDEAGCGPLAGPVMAAAVMFPKSWLEGGLPSRYRGLNDSKQLDEEQREKFFQRITTDPEIRFAISTVGHVSTIEYVGVGDSAARQPASHASVPD